MSFKLVKSFSSQTTSVRRECADASTDDASVDKGSVQLHNLSSVVDDVDDVVVVDDAVVVVVVDDADVDVKKTNSGLHLAKKDVQQH